MSGRGTRLLWTGCVAVALGTMASAQQEEWLDGTIVKGNGPAFFGTAKPKKAEAGMVSDDQLLDVVMIVGDDLWLRHSVHLYGAYYEVPVTSVSDFTVWVGQGDDGDDAIVASGSGGLVSVRPESGSWVTDTLTTLTGTSELQSVDVDGDGDHEIAGLRSDGVTLFWFSGTPGATTESTLVHTNTIYRVRAFDYDDDGAMEFGCLTSVGTEILEQNGTVASSSTVGTQGDLLEVVWNDSGADGLVVVAELSGYQYIWLYGQTGTMLLGAGGTTALSSADLNRDGWGDLVLNSNTQNPQIVLNRYPLDPAFKRAGYGGLETIEMHSSPQSSPGNLSRPILADFDLDGDQDLYDSDAVTGRSWLMENTDYDRSAKVPSPVANSLVHTYDETTQSGTFDVDIARATGSTDTTCYVTVWRVPDVTVDFHFLEPVVFADTFTIGTGGSASVSFPVDEALGDPWLYYMIFTTAKTVGSEIKHGPPLILTLFSSQTAYDELDTTGGPFQTLDDPIHVDLVDPQGNPISSAYVNGGGPGDTEHDGVRGGSGGDVCEDDPGNDPDPPVSELEP